VQRLSKLVVGLACLVVVGGCGSGSPPAQQAGVVQSPTVAAANVKPGNGATLVRYELTGTAVNFEGTYSEPVDGVEKIVELHRATLPWSRNFTLPPNQLFVAGLLAQAPNLESTITCKIIKDGNVVAQQTGPTVDCRAEVS